MSQSRARLTAWTTGIVAALVLAVSLFYLGRSDAPISSPPAPTAATPGPASDTPAETRAESIARTTPRPELSPTRPALKPLAPAPVSDPSERSPLADQLNQREKSIGEDLAVVFNLFKHYRERFGGFPTGEDNREFVNALTGHNPQRLAFLERSHPAINARGELTDRWGTPFFFHLESRDAIEIRSAGPDLEMYTPDDAVQASPGPRPPP